jgi:hypothetical protein
MEPTSYQANPMTTVQCPRCSIPLDTALVTVAERSVEYAGVCTTPLEGAGRCGTSLRLVVTAHVVAVLG